MLKNPSFTAVAGAAAILFQAVLSGATAQPRSTLDIYVVDVEGGNATLYVSPSGESVLMDTGNVAPEAAVRDVGRIMDAVKDAGLAKIDYLIITHWHGDHFGGMAELASRIAIKEFIDHGQNVQPAPAVDEFLQKTYPQLYAKARHTVAKPGYKVAVAGLDWRIVAAGGEHITAPLAGRAGCGEAKPPLFRVQAAGSGQDGERAVRRKPHHVWQISRAAPWRSDLEQRIRLDVSTESRRYG